MKTLPIRRGDIWLSKLDPTLGSEIQKTRPCLIISPDFMNDHLRTITAMPMTSGGWPAPFRLASDLNGKKGLLLGDQLRTLAKQRLIKKVGDVDAATLADVLAMLREMFAE